MARFFIDVRPLLLTGLILSLSTAASAQAPQQEAEQQDQQQQPAPAAPPASVETPPAPPAETPAPPPEEVPTGTDKNRIFGVIPNYTSVEGTEGIKPITTGDSFKMAALDSFDPMVYPLFGFIAGVSHLQNEPPSYGQTWSGYGKRYGLAFADNTICSLITTGLMPSIFKQDPRYYQGRTTGFVKRAGYAASRSVVTKSRSGEPQFNISEIGGTLMVASVGNLYYPQEERTGIATLERWGMQAMWDSVANELKEFWPDIRKAMHGL